MRYKSLNIVGSLDSEIVVVCDAPTHAIWVNEKVMSKGAMDIFAKGAKSCGLSGGNFVFVTPCPPIPDDCTTEGRVSKFVGSYREDLLEVLFACKNKKVVIPLGKNAARAVEGKAVKITKITGRVRSVSDVDAPVYPLISPGMVLRRPETSDQFFSEFSSISELRKQGWSSSALSASKTVDKYRWVTDIQHIIDARPTFIGVDIEYDRRVGIIIVQISYEDGKADVIIFKQCYIDRHKEYFNSIGISKVDEVKIKSQILKLLQNTPCAGHNFKGDLREFAKEGIENVNWWVDTMQLAFAADDNMKNKSLADCTKRWYSMMGGYSDAMDLADKDDTQSLTKERMLDVSPEEMLPYAGGDAEVTRVLAKRLVKIVREDEKNWRCFQSVQMPALKMFRIMEETGLLVDKQKLRNLQDELEQEEIRLYDKLIAQVPDKIKYKHLDKGLKFSRPDFVKDILFSKEGLGLKPVVFTDGTRNLGEDERIPSISSADHLPYFDHIPFVSDLIDYSKLQHLRNTYVGKDSYWKANRCRITKGGKLPKAILDKKNITFENNTLYVDGNVAPSCGGVLQFENRSYEITQVAQIEDATRLTLTSEGSLWIEKKVEPTGFWQYLTDSDKLTPSYHLHRTVTGRTSSSNPNAQNFPKRGKLAKMFRKVFIAPPGYKIIGCDLSQAELRIAAWASGDRNMLSIYRNGGDIHANTAAAILEMPISEFMSWKGSKEPPTGFRTGSGISTLGDLYNFRRFQSKAVNFGFCYGMGWKKFMGYAKTDYGIDLTEKEARKMRNTFFRLYPGLEKWHREVIDFVNKHGFVRALHGAIRRLPSIYSDDESIRKSAERQSINSPVQRFASDLGLIGLSDFFTQGYPSDKVKPLAFIHDAAYVLAREDSVNEIASNLRWCMQNQPIRELFGIKSPIPILSDVEIGDSLALLEEVQVPALMPDWLKA